MRSPSLTWGVSSRAIRDGTGEQARRRYMKPKSPQSTLPSTTFSSLNCSASRGRAEGQAAGAG